MSGWHTNDTLHLLDVGIRTRVPEASHLRIHIQKNLFKSPMRSRVRNRARELLLALSDDDLMRENVGQHSRISHTDLCNAPKILKKKVSLAGVPPAHIIQRVLAVPSFICGMLSSSKKSKN